MTDPVKVAWIAAIVPTLAVLSQWYQQWQAAKKEREKRERDKAEAITARQKLEQGVDDVRTLVNGTSHEMKAEIKALKAEIARLDRDPHAVTPDIQSGEEAPGEVSIDREQSVVNVAREGPFAPKKDL